MRASLHIYREDGKVLFPPGGDDPPLYFDDLSFNYFDFYVDFSRPELVAYLPSKFTGARGNRRENLFFHYQPANPGRLFEEFRQVLRVNDETVPPDKTVSDAVSDTRDVARKNGAVPNTLVGTGLFAEEGWALDKEEPESRLPQALCNTDPGIPHDSRLWRDTLKELLDEQAGKSQPLRFGFETYETALQVIQYLHKNDVGVRVLLAAGGGTASMSGVDIFLDPGYNRDFEPLGDTENLVSERLGQKRSNWKQTLQDEITAAVNTLLEHDDLYELYGDISQILQYMDTSDTSGTPNFHTEAAPEVIEIQDDIALDTELDVDAKGAIFERVYDILEDKRGEVVETIQQRELNRFEKLLDRFSPNNYDFEDKMNIHRDLIAIERLLAGEADPRLRERGSRIERFPEEWERFCQRDLRDPIANYVKDELARQVETRQEELEATLRSRVIHVCQNAKDWAFERTDSDFSQRFDDKLDAAETVWRTFTSPHEKDVEDIDFPEHTELYQIGIQLKDDTYDQELRDRLYKQGRDSLSDGFESAYFEEINTALSRYIENGPQVPEYLRHFEQVIEKDKSVDTSRFDERDANRALETLSDALNDDRLLEEHKQALRDDLRDMLKELGDYKKKIFKNRVNQCIDHVEQEYTEQDSARVEIYNQMEEVLDNPNKFSGSRYYVVRRFQKTWQAIQQDTDHTWRNEFNKETRNEIRRNKPIMWDDSGGMRGPRESDPDQENLSSKGRLSKVSGFVRSNVALLSIIAVVIVVVAVSLIFGVIPFGDDEPGSSPNGGQVDDGGTNGDPVDDGIGVEMALDEPETGATIGGDAVRVRGSVDSSEQVDLTFQSLHSDLELTRTVDVEEGTFDREFDLPIGTYELTVEANRTGQINDESPSGDDESDGASAETLTFSNQGSPTSTHANESESRELDSVSLLLESSEIAVNDESNIDINAEYDDGTDEQVTSEADVDSNNPEIAAVEGNTVIGKSPGTAEIEANYTDGSETVSNTTEITVEEASSTFEISALEAPERIEPNGRMQVQATIENTGDTADNVEVIYERNSDEIDRELTENVQPGGTSTVTFSADAPEEPGEVEHVVRTSNVSERTTTTVASEEQVVAVFTYIGEDPSLSITNIDADANRTTVSADASNTIGHATVVLYDRQGDRVDSRIQEVKEGTLTATFQTDSEHQSHEQYIIEVFPTHAPGQDIRDRRIVEYEGE